MNYHEMKICRLCLNFITLKKFDLLEGSLKLMLGILTPNLKFEITNNPVLCKNCLNSVQKAFEFKTNFFEVEEIIESKKGEGNFNCPTTCDIMIAKHNKKLSQLINYCRTCLTKIEGKLFIDLKNYSEKQNGISILENCLFEMDSTLTSDCKLCLPCYDKLQEMNIFKINCMKNEEIINSHLKKNLLKSNMKLNLHDVVSVLIKEKNYESEMFNVQPYVFKVEPEIKKEYLENLEDNSICGNSSTCKMVKDKLHDHFSSSEIKKKHFTKSKLFRCPENKCQFSARLNCYIQRHLKNVHQKDDVRTKKKFKCSKCAYSTTNNIENIKHLLSHVNADEYRCTQCSYTNNIKSELIKHIFSHIDEQSLKEYKKLDLKVKQIKNYIQL